jgi:hypothetical protein
MGSGYRTFTAGEVLTASNVQNYLQDQAVMVFGGTAARSSAIGTANFEEGMLTYLTDVDKLQVYTGAAFADVYPAAASTQGLTLISTTSFSGVASQSINSVFSATYEFYMIQMKVVCTLNTQNFLWRWRAAGSDLTALNYYNARMQTTTGGVVSGGGAGAGNSAQLNQIATGMGFYSIFAGHTQTEPRLNGNSYNSELSGLTTFASGYRATQAVDGFSIFAGGGNISGTISVYGLAN